MRNWLARVVKSVAKRACGTNEILARIDQLEFLMALYRGDVLGALRGHQALFANPDVTVETEHPVALGSDDHRFPRGTKNDNTRYPRFCYKCEQVFGRQVRFLDLGCAGGGLVLDFLLRGHFAIGLEGSDYSLTWQRAEWRLVPGHLFTCDVTKPFTIRLRSSADPLEFDIISAWEVLEHIPETALPQFFSNIARHLADGGFFVASVATFEDRDPETGAVWHATVRPRGWWVAMAERTGFASVDGVFDAYDFPRLPGGTPSLSADRYTVVDPRRGFHLVLRRRNP